MNNVVVGQLKNPGHGIDFRQKRALALWTVVLASAPFSSYWSRRQNPSSSSLDELSGVSENIWLFGEGKKGRVIYSKGRALSGGGIEARSQEQVHK